MSLSLPGVTGEAVQAEKAISEEEACKGRGICCGCGAGAPAAAANLSSERSLLVLFQQDVDTAVVSDTTDDLWFLNESPSDQSSAAVKVETVDCEEVKEGDKKVPFQTAAACVFLVSWIHGAVLVLEELDL